MKPIVVQFQNGLGRPAKPVNGICNGPIVDTLDFSQEYQQLGIPFVRLHDTNYFGKPYYVDISKIFPNFDADENDPTNYFFQHTDDLLEHIHALGIGTIYRLGESIDHTIYNRYSRPPKDFDKWARICVNIIRHYNDGWADGFRFGIRYWEIWNEPECVNAAGRQVMWEGGTQEEVFLLYRTAVRAIKAYDHSLLVGGMAFTAPTEYARAFISYCQEEGLALDFFSYHKYFEDIEAMAQEAFDIRRYLTESGYGKAKIIFDEWNLLGISACDGDIWKALYYDRKVSRYNHERQKNEVGASFVVGAMIRMNTVPIDIATYYDGQYNMPWCGLFDHYGLAQKTYYAFYAYGVLYRGNRETVSVQCPYDGVYAMAVKDESTGDILLSNDSSEVDTYRLELQGWNAQRAQVYLLDREHDLGLVQTKALGAGEAELRINLPRHSVALVKIDKGTM